MRKTISMLMIFVFGASLWADQNVQKAKSENPRPIVFSERISNDTRTESYTLLMADSYGDGWGGSSLDLSVNGVVVASGLTVTTSDNGGYGMNLTISMSKLEMLLLPHGLQDL